MYSIYSRTFVFSLVGRTDILITTYPPTNRIYTTSELVFVLRGHLIEST